MREPLAWADVTVADELELFLRPRYRHAPIRVACDGISSLGHVVQELGVPLTEVGRMRVNEVPALPEYRLTGGDVVRVEPVPRPQPFRTVFRPPIRRLNSAGLWSTLFLHCGNGNAGTLTIL